MLNEYEDLNLPCMNAEGFDRCDPLGAFDSPQNLMVSTICIAAMYVGTYLISWMIMIKLSKKYE